MKLPLLSVKADWILAISFDYIYICIIKTNLHWFYRIWKHFEDWMEHLKFKNKKIKDQEGKRREGREGEGETGGGNLVS